MAEFNALEWSKFIKEHKNPLLVVGDGCDRIKLSGKALYEYAVSLAETLGCPVAATGNTILALEKSGVKNCKKMWIAEIFTFLKDPWMEPLAKERPDLLILIGYRPDIVNGMLAGAENVHTIHLGPGKASAADLSTDETPIAEWRKSLEELVSAL